MKNTPLQARQGDILLIERQGPIEQIAADAMEVAPREGALVVAVGESGGHRHQVVVASARLFERDGVATLLEITANDGALLEVTSDRGEALAHVRHGAIALRRGIYEIRRQREWSADRDRFVED